MATHPLIRQYPYAGSGAAGSTDAVGVAATFDLIQDLTLDTTNACLYVTDVLNNAVRRINLADAEVTTLFTLDADEYPTSVHYDGSVIHVGYATWSGRATTTRADGGVYAVNTDGSEANHWEIADNGAVTSVKAAEHDWYGFQGNFNSLVAAAIAEVLNVDSTGTIQSGAFFDSSTTDDSMFVVNTFGTRCFTIVSSSSAADLRHWPNNYSTVAASDIEESAVAANTDRETVYFTNLGPDTIGVSASNPFTYSTSPKVLINETRGFTNTAELFIKTDTGNSADVNVNDVTAGTNPAGKESSSWATVYNGRLYYLGNSDLYSCALDDQSVAFTSDDHVEWDFTTPFVNEFKVFQPMDDREGSLSGFMVWAPDWSLTSPTTPAAEGNRVLWVTRRADGVSAHFFGCD